MKLSLSAADRIGPNGPSISGTSLWLSPLVYWIVVPLTLACVAGAGWYIVTGDSPLDVLDDLTQNSSRIVMPMPARPGAESPEGSLLQPPGAAKESTAAPEAPAGGKPAVPDEKLPNISLPTTTPPTETTPPAAGQARTESLPQPPVISPPAIPPGGDPLPPPTFPQLPARADLKALTAAPANDLLRNSGNGPLPVVSGSREPRTVYARPFTVEGNAPRVGVVVTGLGLSRESTEAAISKLPPNVSLSFSPYASNLDNWVKRARGSGHEVLLDLPLEPPNFPVHDAGPLAISTKDGPADAVAHLQIILGKTTSYVGVAAALRSPVSSREQWAPMLHDLKTRGLLFVGDGLSGVAAADTPVSLTVSQVADETPFRAAIDAELGRLLTTAQRDGAAITYVSARPVTFERLLVWFDTFPKKGVVLAPVSAVVRPH
ncbi:divergent polysaccharide deacetylase family protein [Telmatospirillum sp.]|uniref:divergent polysaccharide deacetylase family protein n=1 Tax=Telmatospirillum sp. TaxID=2079197 RepID=UPI002840DAEC|nr:divergent polysaccharide deacetylase family protein [Telmatospirillum sp.]MDR3441103.1 divergent polysaccharide deacetylase family protein [Telmatospirillum sp.]